MSDKELSSATIAGLVDYFGGPETFARILNVKVEDLQRWVSGKERPPSGVFMTLLDMTSAARQSR